jgi:hypothetical protein
VPASRKHVPGPAQRSRSPSASIPWKWLARTPTTPSRSQRICRHHDEWCRVAVGSLLRRRGTDKDLLGCGRQPCHAMSQSSTAAGVLLGLHRCTYPSILEHAVCISEDAPTSYPKWFGLAMQQIPEGSSTSSCTMMFDSPTCHLWSVGVGAWTEHWWWFFSWATTEFEPVLGNRRWNPPGCDPEHNAPYGKVWGLASVGVQSRNPN